jgi:hypothetical protein
MSNKEKSTTPESRLAMCAGIGVMLSFLVLIGFACVKSIKEKIIYKQVKTIQAIQAFEKNIDLLEQYAKVLDDEVKENKIIFKTWKCLCNS